MGETKERPACFKCHWWFPDKIRNPSHEGKCHALRAPTGQEQKTMGHQSCALFDDMRNHPND